MPKRFKYRSPSLHANEIYGVFFFLSLVVTSPLYQINTIRIVMDSNKNGPPYQTERSRTLSFLCRYDYRIVEKVTLSHSPPTHSLFLFLLSPFHEAIYICMCIVPCELIGNWIQCMTHVTTITCATLSTEARDVYWLDMGWHTISDSTTVAHRAFADYRQSITKKDFFFQVAVWSFCLLFVRLAPRVC